MNIKANYLLIVFQVIAFILLLFALFGPNDRDTLAMKTYYEVVDAGMRVVYVGAIIFFQLLRMEIKK